MRTKRTPAQIDELLRAGQSPRYRDLDCLQRLYDGTYYDGRAAWLDNESDKPLLERKPCVIYPSVSIAIESHVNFTLGCGNFPEVLSLTNEDDSDNGGLSPEDSEKLDAFNQRLIEAGKLPLAVRQLLRMAQASKTAVAVLGFRKGLPFVDPVWPKLCTPTFSPTDPNEVVSLEISYRYVDQVFDPLLKEWIACVYQYRRVIDAQSDTTYVPVEIQDKSQFPVPSVADKNKTFKHGFGFCPVVWWRCRAHCEPGATIDGHAVHERITDAVQALDFSLSQRHRAALYCGDPQIVVTGVDPAETFGPSARGARFATPDNPTGDPAKAGEWGHALSGPNYGGKTKKGPGVIWRAESESAKFSILSLTGDSLTAIADNAEDLANKLFDSMSATRIDPVALKGTADISAKAMCVMYTKQLSYVGELRDDFKHGCLLPMLNLFYRMFLAKPAGVFVPGWEKVKGILAKSSQTFTDKTTVWFGPKLELKWPDYFEPSDIDEQTRVTMAVQAKDGGLITTKTAIEHVKGVFNISNVDQYADELKDEKAQNQQDAIDNAAAMAKASPPVPVAGPKPPGGAKQPPGKPPAKAAAA